MYVGRAVRAVVIAAPLLLLIAVVVAAAGATADAEEWQAFAREHLRGSKTPEVVVFRDELPRTPTGKLLRREILADLTG